MGGWLLILMQPRAANGQGHAILGVRRGQQPKGRGAFHGNTSAGTEPRRLPMSECLFVFLLRFIGIVDSGIAYVIWKKSVDTMSFRAREEGIGYLGIRSIPMMLHCKMLAVAIILIHLLSNFSLIAPKESGRYPSKAYITLHQASAEEP
jgi:hypothetical protein